MAYTNPLLFANNAGSSLAGPITNVATTLNVQSGGGALFPNPIGAQAFVVTAIDAATGLLREIMLCTSRSTDTLTVVRAQEGTTALSWLAGDLIQELWTAGQAASMLQSAQFISPVNTYYVNNSIGSDSLYNGHSPTIGLSGNGPWATIAHAISVIQTYSLNNSAVTIQLGLTGITYPGPITISSTTNGNLIINGDTLNQSLYLISGATSPPFGIVNSASGNVTLSGVTVRQTSTGNGVTVSSGVLTLQNVTINMTGSGGSNAVSQSSGSLILAPGNLFTSVAASACITCYGATVTMDGPGTSGALNATFTDFILVYANGSFLIGSGSPTWTSSGTVVGARYSAQLNGVIDTGGAGSTFFPGNAGGSVATGGQYA